MPDAVDALLYGARQHVQHKAYADSEKHRYGYRHENSFQPWKCRLVVPQECEGNEYEYGKDKIACQVFPFHPDNYTECTWHLSPFSSI